ncbi:hypothetical protein LINGRAHAP2_LOCUS5214 [Linum grandiflorum]
MCQNSRYHRRLDRHYLAPHSGKSKRSSRVRRGFCEKKKERCPEFQTLFHSG